MAGWSASPPIDYTPSINSNGRARARTSATHCFAKRRKLDGCRQCQTIRQIYIDIEGAILQSCDMRDDLHKKAPVPRRVQNVFKLALRAADRLHPDRLVIAAQAALDQAVREGMSSATLDRLLQRAPQGELFAMNDGGYQACSPLEIDVLAGLSCRQDASGSEALRDGLAGFTGSWMREIRATMIADGTVPNVAVVMDALSTAFAAAGENLAYSLCANEALALVVPPIQLGENLLPSSSGISS